LKSDLQPEYGHLTRSALLIVSVYLPTLERECVLGALYPVECPLALATFGVIAKIRARIIVLVFKPVFLIC